MAAVLEKLRIPVGSVVVDIGLVVTLFFTAGQMTSRFEAMDRRLAAVESNMAGEKLSERTAVLERRADQNERDRAEILDALHRIESKLDGKQDKTR